MANNPSAPLHPAISIGVQLHQQGAIKEAQKIYLQVLSENPRQFDAHYLLGVASATLGETDGAIHHLKNAIDINPESVMAHYNLGIVLLGAGKTGQAIDYCRNATRLNPLFAEAHNNLGNALANSDQLNEAIKCYEQALKINPQYAEALSNLGNVFRANQNFGKALLSYQRALLINPNFTIALINMAITLVLMRRLREALNAYKKAATLNPDNAQLHNDIGNLLAELREFPAAILSYQKALAITPNNADVQYNIGVSFLDNGDPKRGEAYLRNVIAIEPSHANALSLLLRSAMHSCHFREVQKVWQHLTAIQKRDDFAIDPFVFVGINESPAAELKNAKNFARKKFKPEAKIYGGDIYRHEKIRVAYISADFHEHATAYLMAELFEIHDRKRFEIVGVSLGIDDKSAMRKRLIKSFDVFVDAHSNSDMDVARRLYDLKIDIAVDLKGYTENTRLGILAMRPAPIQVSYLGFPGTTGASFIDYIIGDRVVTPFDQQPYFSEKIVQLPDCYQVNDSKRVISAITPSRKDCGLPEEGFVFCCFNKSAKIHPDIFDVWMRLLKAIEGSVLWLFGENNNLRTEAVARGIAPHRLIFAHRASLEDHLSRQRLADLFLDTLPYNAHTTASDALWAGLPVLTCRGKTFAGRVAASLLLAVGLPELITDSVEAYESLAQKLACDHHALDKIREKLKNNREHCTLFDSHRFCLHIEKAFETMVENYELGEPPKHFLVPDMYSAD